MGTDARPLNPTAASLLGFLHEGPMTGWDLLRRAQERIGSFWTLTQSQVYRELAAMAAAGLVEVGPPGPRDRKPHALTDAGREAFARWLDQDPGPDQIRIPLLLTIAFAEHLPAQRLAALVDAGMLTSVTASAFTGSFGRTVQRFAFELLRQGLVHDVASDAHDAVRRDPGLQAVLESAGLGPYAEHLADTTPQAILRGGAVPAGVVASRAGLRSRLFG